ncbi:MAG: PKD repeat protein, partial [Saprospiraceae bacterium]
MKKGLQLFTLTGLFLALSFSNSIAQCGTFVGFGIDQKLLCPNVETNFYAYGDAIASVLWSFGDGETGTGENLNKGYSAEGKYYVNCTITNSCGKDTTLIDSVVVSSAQPFMFSNASLSVNNEVCPDESFSLDVQQLGNATTVVWNLGSGLSNYKTNSYFDFSYVT